MILIPIKRHLVKHMILQSVDSSHMNRLMQILIAFGYHVDEHFIFPHKMSETVGMQGISSFLNTSNNYTMLLICV